MVQHAGLGVSVCWAGPAVWLGSRLVRTVAIRDHTQDDLGNVIGTHDGATVTQTISYDPRGAPTNSGYMDSRVMWKDLMWEGDVVGLYYMRGRWYDPQAGGFI